MENKKSFNAAAVIGLIIFFIILISLNSFFGLALLYIGIIIFTKQSELKEKFGPFFDSMNIKNGQPFEKNNTSDILFSKKTLPVSQTRQEKMDTPPQFKVEGKNDFLSSWLPGLASPIKKKLEKNKKYLQIALNGTLAEAQNILYTLPQSEKIIIEAGTPLIKSEGMKAVKTIARVRPSSYIVADIKTADLAEREVIMAANAGASAATCLGVAPIETINDFVGACQRHGLDSMVDMMNVENPLLIMKKLKNIPDVVMLHRGVDETEISKGKFIPFYQINQIKGNFNVKVSVAGGDTSREVESAIFNSADVVVVWKNFTRPGKKTGEIVKGFLKQIC